MSSTDRNDELSRIERLAALLRDDRTDVESMDSAQLAQYLKSNQVEMAEPQKRFTAILKKAKAHRRLEIARERRVQAGEKARELLSSGSATFEECRKRVHSMIERIRQCHPEQARFYAREFEKATPEDLHVLEEDLMLLEIDDADDGTRNKQDPS